MNGLMRWATERFSFICVQKRIITERNILEVNRSKNSTVRVLTEVENSSPFDQILTKVSYEFVDFMFVLNSQWGHQIYFTPIQTVEIPHMSIFIQQNSDIPESASSSTMIDGYKRTNLQFSRRAARCGRVWARWSVGSSSTPPSHSGCSVLLVHHNPQQNGRSFSPEIANTVRATYDRSPYLHWNEALASYRFRGISHDHCSCLWLWVCHLYAKSVHFLLSFCALYATAT